MKIMEALASKNLMLVNGNRWLVMNDGIFTVFEHRFRKVTDVQLFSGEDEESAVRFLIEGDLKPDGQDQA